jgi:hypothetical protein
MSGRAMCLADRDVDPKYMPVEASDRFIKLHAQGWSLRRITADLNVHKMITFRCSFGAGAHAQRTSCGRGNYPLLPLALPWLANGPGLRQSNAT